MAQRFHRLFVILTGMLLLLFFIEMWEDTHREWTRYQRQFLGRLHRDERRGQSGGVKQLIVKDLHRVDRCTTCHLAIEKPQLALAEEPFTAHPGTWLESHPPEKFGCTVCHGGQGLATEVKAAHGDVPHWEEPLLRGALVQASCAQCHGQLEKIAPHVPLVLAGRQLFKAGGCYGCHAIKDFGQTVSQDLTEVGSKSYLLLEADFEMMDEPHDRIRWLAQKVQHPRVLNPGVRPEALPPGEEEVYPSAMPYFGFTPEETQALTAYLLSLKASDYPASYVTHAVPEPAPVVTSSVEHGKAVFERFGCAGCHGIGGVGGRHNWNGGLGEEVPSLLYVKAYYGNDVESVKNLIRHGRQPVPRADPTRPNPALYMPAWKDRISEEEIDALVAYLFSLSERLPQAAPPARPATSNQEGPAAKAPSDDVTIPN